MATDAEVSRYAWRGGSWGSRSERADVADYDWCGPHSRYFWRFPVARDLQPGRHPMSARAVLPELDERDGGLVLLDRCQRHGGDTLLGDKGYACRGFAAAHEPSI
jgi:hypothetical protein